LRTISTEEFEKFIDEIFDEMKKILIEKNKSYGSASFEGENLAILGNYFRLSDKINRYRKLMQNYISSGAIGSEIGETVQDTVRDIFGYATIGLTILKLMNEEVESFPGENLRNEGLDLEYYPFGYDYKKDPK
jgi:hypothetical protein